MAARSAENFYTAFCKGRHSHEDFFQRELAARSAEIFYNAFCKEKSRYKDFYKEDWPRAARKFFEIGVY